MSDFREKILKKAETCVIRPKMIRPKTKVELGLKHDHDKFPVVYSSLHLCLFHKNKLGNRIKTRDILFSVHCSSHRRDLQIGDSIRIELVQNDPIHRVTFSEIKNLESNIQATILKLDYTKALNSFSRFIKKIKLSHESVYYYSGLNCKALIEVKINDSIGLFEIEITTEFSSKLRAKLNNFKRILKLKNNPSIKIKSKKIKESKEFIDFNEKLFQKLEECKSQCLLSLNESLISSIEVKNAHSRFQQLTSKQYKDLRENLLKRFPSFMSHSNSHDNFFTFIGEFKNEYMTVIHPKLVKEYNQIMIEKANIIKSRLKL